MIHSELGFIHTLAAALALALGAFAFLGRKGTHTHKIIGYGYVASMAVMVISAFCIYT